ncbi:MAG TPA: F-box/WD40 repeat-containing protein [Rhabdochlamydiaceae bacterium]|nr:F-box/WD40 repeat-containing protein [Rhabdochlamydiaceae bacterium]
MSIESSRYYKELKNLKSEMVQFRTNLSVLSTNDILQSLSLLESKYTKIHSMQRSLEYKEDINKQNPKDIENQVRWINHFDVKLKTIKEIWNECFNDQFAKIEKMLEQPVKANHKSTLTKLNHELKQLLFNSPFNDEQKVRIRKVQEKANKVLIEAEEMKQASEESKASPDQTKPIDLENAVRPLELGAFNPLPFETLFKILSYLSPQDFFALAQGSKDCKQLCNDSYILKELLNDPQIANINPQLLKTGFYTVQKLNHQSPVGCFCKKENILYSGAADGTIKIWDLTNKTCKATLKGHENDIYCLCTKGNFLYSGSADGTIKVWDLETNECKATLNDHKGPITSLCINKNFLCSGSADGTIKVWNLDTNECEITLEAGSSIECLCIQKNVLYSGSADGKIKIWDLSTNQCKATFEEHQHPVKCLCIEENVLYSGSADGKIKIWDLNSNQCTATLSWDGSVDCLCKYGNFLYAGYISIVGDMRINIWDLSTNQLAAPIGEHQKKITSLYREGKCLYSSSLDGTINIWDLKVSYPSLLKAAETILDKQDFSYFISLGNACKYKIYKELYDMEQFSCGYLHYAETVFLNPGNYTTTNEKRAQAIYRVVLKEILSRFNNEEIKEGIALFKKLPTPIKNDIYGALLKILGWRKKCLHCAEHAFLDLTDPKVNGPRIKAIQNHLSLKKDECLIS